MHKTDDFSDRLALKMHKLGFTQESLAARMGCSHSTVSRWMSGSKPRKSTAHGLASVLETTTKWLLDGGNEKPPVNLEEVRAEKRNKRTIQKRIEVLAAGLDAKVERMAEEYRAALSQFPSASPGHRRLIRKDIESRVDEFEAWCDELVEPKTKEP